MRPDERLAVALILSIPLLAPPGAAAQEAPGGDAAKTQEVADRLMAALGGEEAWAKTRYLSFGFAGRRTHWWDRHTGRHRLEGTTREGESYVVLHDVDDQGKQGRAWLAGKPAEGDKAAELIENAYAAWINDTYWLLAPYKIRDPGVTLAYAGQETVGGTTYDKLHLSFQNVGLTPGDQYWLYVHPETGRVDRWAYVLEDQEPPPTVWEWKNWQQYGPGIWLADGRFNPDSGRELPLSPITVPDELPDSVFESPEPVP